MAITIEGFTVVAQLARIKPLLGAGSVGAPNATALDDGYQMIISIGLFHVFFPRLPKGQGNLRGLFASSLSLLNPRREDGLDSLGRSFGWGTNDQEEGSCKKSSEGSCG
jgi:hypothetical protein